MNWAKMYAVLPQAPVTAVTTTVTNCTANENPIHYAPLRIPLRFRTSELHAVTQLLLDLVRAPAPTLENFVPGRNAELLHSLRAAAAGGTGSSSIYVWGAPGSGRSHLLQAWISAARERGRSAYYLPCASEPHLGRHLSELACVAIDDVGHLAAEEQVSLFNLYNAQRERGALMVVSGDAPPRELPLRLDLATRLAWGPVYQLHPLTDEEKAGALQDYAAARGMRLPEEVCAYLFARVGRDLGTLLGVLDAIDRSSLAARRAITVPFVREWLQAGRVQD